MFVEVMKTLLPVVSAIFSVGASLFLSLRATRQELNRFQFERKGAHVRALLDKRLERYPAIYEIVSDLAKKVRKQAVTSEVLCSAMEAINVWDSKNAIFMSVRVTMLMGDFRRRLSELQKEVEVNGTAQGFESAFLNLIGRLELGLKADLMIFEVEDLHTRTLPTSLREAAARVYSELDSERR